MMPPYTPAADDLGHTAPLMHTADLPLFGVPLRFRSNSAALIAVAERAFGRWRKLPATLQSTTEALLVDVIVHNGAGEARVPPRLAHRAHGSSYVAADGATLLTARTDLGEALAFIPAALLEDEANLRYNVVELLALLLVSHRDRTPVHAAALAYGGRAALLVGPSGAGKSTLCYAGARIGLRVLAEDAVYVGLENGLRIWGNPGRIHLLPDAPRFFPDLAGLAPQVQANGKRKLAVDVPDEPAAPLPVTQALLCFIERAAGRQSRLEALPAATAAAAIAQPREMGFDLLREQAPAVAEALAARGAYRLLIGSDPQSAAALLAHLLETDREKIA